MESNFNFLVYQTAQENVSVNALVKDETIWLTQKAMAELFDVDKSSISRHLKNIFKEGELDEKVVVAKIATTTQHGAEEKQIRQLERAVTGYFDYIEDLIERENTFTMEEFAASVNEFLAFRRYDILRDKGKISGRMAKEKASAEYEEFNKTQKITSDFDKAVNRMLKAGEQNE